MKGYRSFAITVQGVYHIKNGIVCQDASAHYDDEGVSIAVVADGHGDPTCFRSDRGAAFAVECATTGIRQFVKEQEALFRPPSPQSENNKSAPPSRSELEKLLREKLIIQIVTSWNTLVMEDHRKYPFRSEEMEKADVNYRKLYESGEAVKEAYGTTLIAAAITPRYWFGLHVGDGRFSVLYRDGSGGQPVPWDPRCYLNVTTSLCDDDILDNKLGVRAFLSMMEEEEPPAAFFLCSDGIDDNFPVKENEVYLYGFYNEIAATCAENGCASTFGGDGASGFLKKLVNSFATRGKGDDTSLAGIVDIKALRKIAAEWREDTSE